MKLIDKDALIAEIEKKKIPFKKDIDDGVYPTYLCALMDFEDFINTLEVKEVDLERLINDYFTGWYFDSELDILAKPNNYSATISDVKEIAKHFFELGMQVCNNA